MRMLELIEKKKRGEALSRAEIEALVNGYTNDRIPDYQMAAFLMAVYFRSMTPEETADLTEAMAASGELADLSGVRGVKVDKHSTGGVGDTTTLVVLPLVAAAGATVAKMSGRGLGFTGGTIDKLEAIAGFETALTKERFVAQLKAWRMAITGQSAEIAPADGKLYALRDVTGTVDSIPLIASSIMSKKIAAGADKILLDVKVGSGAFMRSREEAVALAQAMVDIGKKVGRQTRALLTNMDEPLGRAVGNALEVKEAIEVLSGSGPRALRDVCLALGAHLLQMAGKAETVEEGAAALEALLQSGAGLAKLKELVIAQGGDASYIEHPEKFPRAPHSLTAHSAQSGYVAAIDAARIGSAAAVTGAGRMYKGQKIDLAAGLTMRCRVGDFLSEGDALAVLEGGDPKKLAEAARLVQSAIRIARERAAAKPAILGLVDERGFHAV